MFSTSLSKSVLRLTVMALLSVPYISTAIIKPRDNTTMLFINSVPFLSIFTLLFGFANAIFVKANLVNDDHSGFLPIDKND